MTDTPILPAAFRPSPMLNEAQAREMATTLRAHGAPEAAVNAHLTGQGFAPLDEASPISRQAMALARRDALMRDPAFVRRYNEGGMGSDEYRQMMELNTILASGD